MINLKTFEPEKMTTEEIRLHLSHTQRSLTRSIKGGNYAYWMHPIWEKAIGQYQQILIGRKEVVL